MPDPTDDELIAEWRLVETAKMDAADTDAQMDAALEWSTFLALHSARLLALVERLKSENKWLPDE